jgi:uncharacterized protein YjdB
MMLLAVFCFSLPGFLAAQTLQNDWLFNENGGGTAVDSVSGSNITLQGGASLGGGVLNLPGGAGNYAQLPAGILSSFTNSMTIETWFTDQGGQTWSRLWSIGGSTSTFAANNANYIDLIPQAGGANNINGGFWAEFNRGGGAKDAAASIPASAAADRTPVKVGSPVYATLVFDGPSQTARLYFNGVLVGKTVVGFKPSDMGNTMYNTLGLDQYNDAPFQGTVDEMRIWNGAVSQRYISASLAAGPGVVINNLTPTAASLVAGPALVLTETEPAAVYVQLTQTASANLQATADATNWVSSNPSVITVSSNGLINAVGLGTATVSAVIAGNHVTSGSITVTNQILQHEWSFNESSGTTAFDTVGTANIALQGTTSLGGGVLTLPGGAGNYATLAGGILSSNYSVTIETWLTDQGGQTWSRAWSLGGSVTVAGNLIQNNYIDLIPKSGPGALWTEFKSGIPALTTYDTINAGGQALPTGREVYVTVVYNAQNQTCTMYSNGVVAATLSGIAITPASLGNTLNNYIGLDQWNDPIFKGTFDEMRIWDGAQSPTYMLLAAAAGPGVVITNTTPQSLTVSAGASLLGSQTEPATVTGNFIQANGVGLTSVVTSWTSSDPSVLTVNGSGLITGVSGGSATVSATVNGVTGTSSLITVATTSPTISQGFTNVTAVIGDTLVLGAQALGGSLVYQWSMNSAPITGATNASLSLTNIQPGQAGTYSLSITNTSGSNNLSAMVTVVLPLLQHEWSFNENGGSTAVDSISASNITLLGGCSLGGGVLTLPGGAGNYAQFTNGILSTYSNSITIETWLTDNGGLTWARPWSFGGGTAGTNSNFSHGNYIDLIPTAGNANGINGGLWTEFNHAGTNVDAYMSTPLPTATEEYVTVTYQKWDQTIRIYLNGAQVGMATNVIWSPSDMGFTYNNFIGLDQWNDAIFNGTFDEMRIWNGAVTPLYEFLSATAGPGVLITNTTPQSANVTIATSLVPGQTQQVSIVGDFVQVSGVPLTSYVTNWMSSNPGVLSVSSNGLVTAISPGNAQISAQLSLGMSTTSAVVTVTASAPVITQQPIATEQLLAGATLRASVGTIGSQPFTYYWFVNSGTTPISISTLPALTVPNVQVGNSGSYTCLVSNQYGTALSAPLNLTVVSATTYQQAILALGPVSFWPLNEADGTTAYDLVGGQNGTYTGTYVLNQSGPPNTFFGGAPAAVFDGTSGHVDIPGTAFNLTGPVTVVAWVQILSAPTFDGLVGRGDTSWRMSINPNGQPGGNSGDAQGDATDPIAAPGLNDGNWHMVAYTYSGNPGQNNNGALYVDGALAANNTVTAAPVGNNLDVWIGGSPDYTGRFLPAYIADVAVFNQPLTANQVQGMFNGTAVAGPQTISITLSGANVILNWQTGTLLQATNLLGPWTTNNAATPGYTLPATNTSQFFKLLIP